MKQYEYGNVAYIMKDVVLAVTMEHRDIINDYAVKGYRCTKKRSHGKLG